MIEFLRRTSCYYISRFHPRGNWGCHRYLTAQCLSPNGVCGAQRTVPVPCWRYWTYRVRRTVLVCQYTSTFRIDLGAVVYLGKEMVFGRMRVCLKIDMLHRSTILTRARSDAATLERQRQESILCRALCRSQYGRGTLRHQRARGRCENVRSGRAHNNGDL